MKIAHRQRIPLLLIASLFVLSCTPKKERLDDNLEGFWRLKTLSLLRSDDKPTESFTLLRKELAKMNGLEIKVKDYKITLYREINDVNECERLNVRECKWRLTNSNLRIFYSDDRYIDEGSIEFSDSKLEIRTDTEALITMAQRALNHLESKIQKENRESISDIELPVDNSEIGILQKEINELRENKIHMVRTFSQEKERPKIIEMPAE